MQKPSVLMRVDKTVITGVDVIVQHTNSKDRLHEVQCYFNLDNKIKANEVNDVSKQKANNNERKTHTQLTS